MNEYQETMLIRDMEKIITERSWNDSRNWSGYRDESDFHFRNHSLRGPNGLLRHVADGRLCIAHGEGTWDIMRGEFS